MCSVELKLRIDLLVKWFHSIYKMRFLELDQLTKQSYEKNNRIDWLQTSCCICDLKLSLGSFFGPKNKKMRYLDFIKKRIFVFTQYI